MEDLDRSGHHNEYVRSDECLPAFGHSQVDLLILTFLERSIQIHAIAEIETIISDQMNDWLRAPHSRPESWKTEDKPAIE